MRKAECQQKYISLQNSEQVQQENQNNLDELLDLIPKFLDSQLRGALIKQIDLNETQVDQKELISAYNLINSADTIQIHKGLVIFRKFVSSVDSLAGQLINDVVKFENIIPQFIQIAKTTDIPLITYEVAWILSNIASGPSSVIQNDGLELLIELLQSPYIVIANQAVWGVTNLISENPQYRLIVQESGVISNLISLIEKNQIINNIETCIWGLRIISKEFNFQQVGPGQALFFDVIHTFIKQIQIYTKSINKIQKLPNKQQDLLKNCFEGLLAIVKRFPLSHMQLMVEDFITYLVSLIPGNHTLIQSHALQILGTIIEQENNDIVINQILEADILNALLTPLKQNSRQLIQIIFWILLNLIEGSQFQRNYVISNKEILDQVFLKMKTNDLNLSNNIRQFLINIINNSSEKELNYLIDQGLFESINHILQFFIKTEKEVLAIHTCLDLLNQIFQRGISQQGKQNIFTGQYIQTNGLEIIQQLLSHSNKNVVNKCLNLLETYKLE